MKTIIHDLNIDEINEFKQDDSHIINTNLCQNTCTGCFSCWIKHPKKCIYKDAFSNLTDILKKTDELIIISKARYGCYSTAIKRVLERMLGYVLPYFKVREKMIHHTPRYKHQLTIKTCFYGDISEKEKECLYNLVKANSINFNTKEFVVSYYKNIEEIINAYTN